MPEILTDVPADLAILPPAPGSISTLCKLIPDGISLKGIQFPFLISIFEPFCKVSPTLTFCGAK